VEVRSFHQIVRAQILLARGEVEAGLRALRRVAGLMRDTVDRGDLPGLEGWTLEVEQATVIAHAGHGRLDALPERLSAHAAKGHARAASAGANAALAALRDRAQP
jgi:hypothetical protein